MKYINLPGFILLILFAFPCFGESMFLDTAKITSLFNQANADRILLIGFEDQTISRVAITPLATSYRRRGQYASSTWSQRITAQIERDYHIQKLAEWPMTEVGVHCAVYLVPETLDIEKVIAQLGQDKHIDIVQRMNQFHTKARLYNDPYYKLQSNVRDMQIDQAHLLSTGRGVVIAMIDTGVDMEHPDLAGQIDNKKNFAYDVSRSFSTDMHGTAMAGILVARSDNETGIIGVAPHSSIIALKACWPHQTNSFDAVCNSFTLALAVNSAIKSGARIINMSLSGPPDPLVELLLKKATKKGIIVIAADPGLSSNHNRFPASMKNVISVQTIQEFTTNKIQANRPIQAEGNNVLTTLPHGTYDFVSGSSVSAAQISGIIALMLELKPDLTLLEIKKILQQSLIATSQTVNKHPDQPRYAINANTAVMAVCRKVACSKYL